MYRLPSCPVCGSSATRELLTRGNVPVHQNLVMPDRASARGIACGSLAMRLQFEKCFYDHSQRNVITLLAQTAIRSSRPGSFQTTELQRLWCSIRTTRPRFSSSFKLRAGHLCSRRNDQLTGIT